MQTSVLSHHVNNVKLFQLIARNALKPSVCDIDFRTIIDVKASSTNRQQNRSIDRQYHYENEFILFRKQEEDDYAFARALQESERQELQRIRRNVSVKLPNRIDLCGF